MHYTFGSEMKSDYSFSRSHSLVETLLAETETESNLYSYAVLAPKP